MDLRGDVTQINETLQNCGCDKSIEKVTVLRVTHDAITHEIPSAGDDYLHYVDLRKNKESKRKDFDGKTQKLRDDLKKTAEGQTKLEARMKKEAAKYPRTPTHESGDIHYSLLIRGPWSDNVFKGDKMCRSAFLYLFGLVL